MSILIDAIGFSLTRGELACQAPLQLEEHTEVEVLAPIARVADRVEGKLSNPIVYSIEGVPDFRLAALGWIERAEAADGVVITSRLSRLSIRP